MNKYFNLKYVVISFLLLIQINFAQIKIGAKAGLSLAKLSGSSDNLYSQDYKSKAAADFGIIGEFLISDLFSIQSELIYATRGGVRTGLQPIQSDPLTKALADNGVNMELLNRLIELNGRAPISDENPLYADYRSESDLHYLEIPILAKFGWGTDWHFYADAGPYFGFLLDAKQITSGTSKIFLDAEGNQTLLVPNPLYDPDNPGDNPEFWELAPKSFDVVTDTKDKLESFNVGVHFGVGVSKKLANKHEVFFDVRGSFGFIPLQKDETFGESRVGSIVLALGYAYTLGSI